MYYFAIFASLIFKYMLNTSLIFDSFYGKPCQGNCKEYHTFRCPIYKLSNFTVDNCDDYPFGVSGCSYFLPVASFHYFKLPVCSSNHRVYELRPYSQSFELYIANYLPGKF